MFKMRGHNRKKSVTLSFRLFPGRQVLVVTDVGHHDPHLDPEHDYDFTNERKNRLLAKSDLEEARAFQALKIKV